MTINFINGYKINFNEYRQEYQIWHSEIGHCEDFKSYNEAAEYCKKG